MRRLLGLASILTRKRPPVGSTPADVVHSENKWRLLRYRRAEPARFETPVLLVPSLINRHYVLDLLPEKSFVEWLVARGHDVYCIDWGTPSAEDRYLTFDDVCDRYLGRALHQTGKAHVLGYCMGATLAGIYAALEPAHVAALLNLAGPFDFAHGGFLRTMVDAKWFDVHAIAEAGNVAPMQMQSGFLALRPTMEKRGAAAKAKCVAVGAAFTVTVAEPVAVSVTVSVATICCEPAVAKVTLKT